MFGNTNASKHKEYAEGIGIVPILAMGSVFLEFITIFLFGKLTNRNMFERISPLPVPVITILLNMWWIPTYRYFGSAWATFVCYAL
jgi:hypothetical protein